MTKKLLGDEIFYRRNFPPTNTFCRRTYLADEYFLPDGFKLLCSFFCLKINAFDVKFWTLPYFMTKKTYRNWKKCDNLPIFRCFTVFPPLISLKNNVLSIPYGKKISSTKSIRRQKVTKFLASDESFCRRIVFTDGIFHRRNFYR